MLTSQRYLRLARLGAQNNDFIFAAKAAQSAYKTYKSCLGMESQKTKDAEKSVRAFRKQMTKPWSPLDKRTS